MLQCRIYPKKTEIRKRFLKVTQTFFASVNFLKVQLGATADVSMLDQRIYSTLVAVTDHVAQIKYDLQTWGCDLDRGPGLVSRVSFS